MHTTTPTAKKYLAQNASSAKVEKFILGASPEGWPRHPMRKWRNKDNSKEKNESLFKVHTSSCKTQRKWGAESFVKGSRVFVSKDYILGSQRANIILSGFLLSPVN